MLKQKIRCAQILVRNKLSYTTQHSIFFYWYQKSIIWKNKTKKKNPVVYKTDKIANLHGHEVIRTPVRHCELNPIELIWAQVKGFVAKNNTTFRLKDVKRTRACCFRKNYKRCVDKSRRTCGQNWKKNTAKKTIDRSVIEPIIIAFCDDDSDDDAG